jgi:large subunit ribosomal protein L28e
MATVPGQLIWEIVKKNNCFLVKQFGRGTASLRFSKESNNLYNLNSYKHSGTLSLSLSLSVRACLSVSLTLSWLMFSLKGLCARFCLI